MDPIIASILLLFLLGNAFSAGSYETSCLVNIQRQTMLRYLCFVYTYTLSLFYGCNTADLKNLTVFVNEALNINCTDNTVINIKDIGVENNYNKCSNKYCQITGNETSTIENSCNNKTSCEVALDFLNSCFRNYGYFNISYVCATIAINCSFDDGLCGWSISVDSQNNDDFIWTVGNGSISPPNTGPDNDHTTGNPTGGYIYAKSNANADDFYRTNFTSPIIYPSTAQCLSFWYHMYGQNINWLHVYHETLRESTIIWKTAFNKGNKWLYQMIKLQENGPYQIVFRARRGKGEKSEIALDDIVIANKECSVSDHDCNFEKGMCLWSTDAWTRNSGRTDTSDTGPSFDHSLGTGTGFYLYMEASPMSVGKAIYLNSSIIVPSGNSCFTFWYNMYGSHMGTLEVFLVTEESTKPVWSESGNKRNRWLFAAFDISISQNYSVSLKGIRGEGVKSDMAIDDIILFPSSCSDFNRSLSTLEEGNGSMNYSQTCVNPKETINLRECSTNYLLTEQLKFDFEPNYPECSDTYQCISNTTSKFCSDIDKPDICPVSMNSSLQKRPECYLAHRLSLQYSCEEKIPDSQTFPQQRPNLSDASLPGIIGGVVAGILLLMCVLIIILYCRRRLGQEDKSRITEDNNYDMKDYAGIQNISLSVSDKQPTLHSQMKETQRVTYEDQYYNLTVGVPSSNENVNIKSNGIKNQNDTEYANINKDAPQYYKNMILNVESGQNYVILDPKETGFNRSNELIGISTEYRINGLAEKLAENSLTPDLDHYVTTEDGAYDSAGVIRHKETDSNVYSHSVDNVYDSASHTVKRNESFDTYDHFIGEKTEDNYDLTN